MDLLDQISLEHVRVRGVRRDATVAKLRLSHLLANAELHPPAMPPSAVLVVCSMADPLPGRIAVELSAASTTSAEWEHAARDRLGELYARAARPAWGPVSPTAEAVLFADYGELLACLARDVSSGSTGAWYWRSIVKRYGLGLPGSWANFWAEHPRYVPSALKHLDARREALAVLQRIAPVQAWRLLLEVARVFDLPGSLIPPGPPSARQTDAPDQPVQTAPTDRESRPTESRTVMRLPWEPYVPRSATPAVLGLERRALLGVGLLLCRAPAVALTPGFSFRFRDWLRTVERSEASQEADVASTAFTPFHSSGKVPVPTQMPSGVPPQARGPAPHRVPPSAESRGEPLVSHQPQPRSEVADGSPRVQRSDAQTGQPIQSPRAPRPQSPPDKESGVDTRWGGILYLIHVVRQMELVRHFDTGLSGWALVELLARCLMRSAITPDPIWEALADLDERDPRVAAGDGFEPQSIYLAPDSWLRNLLETPTLLRCRSRGIELWRPEGFPVLDSEERPAAYQGEVVPLTRRDRRRFRRAAEVRSMGISISRELRRFLHFVLPYARWRLDQVLRGISLEEVFFRPGKLIVSSSHVDLVMTMKQISVPVRLAGLDANPGWVPELGRVVTFHFVAEGFGG